MNLIEKDGDIFAKVVHLVIRVQKMDTLALYNIMIFREVLKFNR